MPKVKQVFVPRPEEDREPIPQLNQLISNPSQRLMVLRKVTRFQELKDSLTPILKEQAKLKDEIKDLLGQHQIDKCMIDDLRVSYYGSTRSTLKKELLLEEGVSAATIAKCTVPGKTSYTLKIARVGEEEEEI